MGRGKLEANGTVGLYCTRDRPWQASLHQLYGLRPPEGSAGVSVPRAAILSGTDRRLMMSAARLDRGREASHTGHEAWVESEQKSVT